MTFRILDRTLETLLFLALAAMGAIVSANVFCRFVLNFSIYWGDEAAQSLLVWLTFLGSAIAVRDRAHYAFDSLVSMAPGAVRRHLNLISRLIVLGATAGLLYWSARVAWDIRPWIMPAMGISRGWLYMAGPVGSLFMLLYGVRDLAAFLRDPAVANTDTRIPEGE